MVWSPLLTMQMRNDVSGDQFPALVRNCPDSLQRLSLEGFGCDMEQRQLPQHSVQCLNLLECHLLALTQVSLTRCAIHGEHITCLIKLKSLSLKSSEIFVEGQLEAEKLTDLTYFDLSESFCCWEGAEVEAADSFTSWPGLEMLDLTCCNLIGWNTVLNVASVQQVHANLPASNDFLPPQQLHAHIHVPQEAAKFVRTQQSQIDDAVVDLRIDVSNSSRQGGAQAAMTVLWQVISLCPNMQSLHGVNPAITFNSLAQLSEVRHALAG